MPLTFPLDHGVRCQGADEPPVRHRVPDEIPGDEDIGAIREQDLQVLLDLDDPIELQRILRHRCSVALRVGIIRVDT